MRFSVIIGIVGGSLDLAVGLLVLLAVPMVPSGAMGAGAAVGGILLVLGGAVLTTVLYTVATPMAATRGVLGGAMLVYGCAMIFVAGAMLARWVPMMSGSEVSGATMIVVGGGMLYSGATMARKSAQ